MYAEDPWTPAWTKAKQPMALHEVSQWALCYLPGGTPTGQTILGLAP